jgi:hypothetical protein
MGNAEEDDMADTTATPAVRSAEHPLIESHRVEGTRVFDRDGKHVGTIDHLVIEKVSGRVVYVVASFGGFLASASASTPSPGSGWTTTPSATPTASRSRRPSFRTPPSLPHDADEEREEMLRAYWALGPHGL